ncbi:hypothetical protein GALMADRAFT_1326737 [Galerina marginata CBS 339.88]|uniref:Uncharacterized protein n=1 Tax=Galerina marginata (strain CBS 339.88) TaxID=685588 RepID=A0A067TD13_GALM3|nr:hypothetical protein GALMADRAFT_1326737 [Galerina marginata CBS 339.88]
MPRLSGVYLYSAKFLKQTRCGHSVLIVERATRPTLSRSLRTGTSWSFDSLLYLDVVGGLATVMSEKFLLGPPQSGSHISAPTVKWNSAMTSQIDAGTSPMVILRVCKPAPTPPGLIIRLSIIQYPNWERNIGDMQPQIEKPFAVSTKDRLSTLGQRETRDGRIDINRNIRMLLSYAVMSFILVFRGIEPSQA